MIDHAIAPPRPLRARHDGWTAERQERFLAALTAGGSIAAAAAAAGLSRQSAYRLRRRDPAVAAAWGSPPIDRGAHADRLADIVAGLGEVLSVRIDAAAAADPRGHGTWLRRELVALRKRRFASTSVTFQRRAAVATAKTSVALAVAAPQPSGPDDNMLDVELCLATPQFDTPN